MRLKSELYKKHLSYCQAVVESGHLGSLENIFQPLLQEPRVLWKRYLSISWTELLWACWRNKGTYYINKKNRGLITIFITIFKCIEFFCYTKCLITCFNYYIVSGMYNENGKWLIHGIRFRKFRNHIQFKLLKKKKKNLIHWKIPFSYAASTTFLIYNTCNLQVTLFLSVNQIDFTITICSLKTQNYV